MDTSVTVSSVIQGSKYSITIVSILPLSWELVCANFVWQMAGFRKYTCVPEPGVLALPSTLQTREWPGIVNISFDVVIVSCKINTSECTIKESDTKSSQCFCRERILWKYIVGLVNSIDHIILHNCINRLSSRKTGSFSDILLDNFRFPTINIPEAVFLRITLTLMNSQSFSYNERKLFPNNSITTHALSSLKTRKGREFSNTLIASGFVLGNELKYLTKPS